MQREISNENVTRSSAGPWRIAAVVGTLGSVLAISGATAQNDAPAAEERNTSPFQRGPQFRIAEDSSRVRSAIINAAPASYPSEFRTLDGWGNNTAFPERGATGTPFARIAPADYGDGVGSPAGAGRPSPRLVSNEVFLQPGDMPNSRGFSDMFWQWGQFLDHDITETPTGGGIFDIDIPAGDPQFDPGNFGDEVIEFDRSAWVLENGVREQINNITSFIDGSAVYGVEHLRADYLRTLDGTGMLKTSAGNLMPFNLDGFENSPPLENPTLFLAGDIRANEQTALIAIHTLFVREHNRLALEAAAANPAWDGDRIYEHCRALVAAQMQFITYKTFLPRLVGPTAMPAYTGYDPAVDPSAINAFATAAFRIGHTMLSANLARRNADGTVHPSGDLPLRNAFFRSDQITSQGIDPILRGLAFQRAQEADSFVVEDVRSFLFGDPGAGGFDLPALNIQRGRDHGLPSYNAVRAAVGLAPAAAFTDVHSDPAIAGGLAAAYASPADIDLWTGMLAEPHITGGFIGETAAAVIVEQFVRLRDGDRFWYESYLPADLVAFVESRDLADIVRDNTGIGAELQDDIFIVPDFCVPDLTKTNTNPGEPGYGIPDGTVDGQDIAYYVERWLMLDLDRCDLTTTNTNPGELGFALPDGSIDGADLAFYVEAWLNSCP